jgi:hypothetical protein
MLNAVTLLQQIESEAADTNSDLPAHYVAVDTLAQRLGVDEFENWTVWELEGYPSVESLPDYRIIETSLRLGHFTRAFGRQLQDAHIPLLAIPKKMRRRLTAIAFSQRFASIGQILRGNDRIRVPWTADVLPSIGQGDIYSTCFRLAN